MEAPQAEMSVVGRILRVFYAPSETFEAVAEQRSAAELAGADHCSRDGGLLLHVCNLADLRG